jgi:hypothetical protein
MTKPNAQPNHVDKRTGIVYTNVGIIAQTTAKTTAKTTTQPHLDAFIPNAFLKTYFACGKSKI